MLFPVPLWGFDRVHQADIKAKVIRQMVNACPERRPRRHRGGSQVRPQRDSEMEDGGEARAVVATSAPSAAPCGAIAVRSPWRASALRVLRLIDCGMFA